MPGGRHPGPRARHPAIVDSATQNEIRGFDPIDDVLQRNAARLDVAPGGCKLTLIIAGQPVEGVYNRPRAGAAGERAEADNSAFDIGFRVAHTVERRPEFQPAIPAEAETYGVLTVSVITTQLATRNAAHFQRIIQLGYPLTVTKGTEEHGHEDK